MTQVSSDFETGVDGNAITTGDSGSPTAFDNVFQGALGAFCRYDIDHAYDSLAMLVHNGTGTTDIGVSWIGARGVVTEEYGRFYIWRTSTVPSSGAGRLVYTQDSSNNNAAQIRMKTDYTLELLDGANNIRYTSTTALTQDAWTRVEFHFVYSTTVGRMEMKIFTDPDSETPAETVGNMTDNWNLRANGDEIRFGICGTSGPPTSIDLWFDHIMAGAASYPGPAVAASQPGYQRLYGPAQLATSAADLYTVPDGALTRVRHIYVNNPSGAEAEFTCSVGADAAATRLYDQHPIPAGESLEWAYDHALMAGEKIQAFSDVGSTLVATIDGFVESV